MSKTPDLCKPQQLPIGAGVWLAAAMGLGRAVECPRQRAGQSTWRGSWQSGRHGAWHSARRSRLSTVMAVKAVKAVMDAPEPSIKGEMVGGGGSADVLSTRPCGPACKEAVVRSCAHETQINGVAAVANVSTATQLMRERMSMSAAVPTAGAVSVATETAEKRSVLEVIARTATTLLYPAPPLRP